jgi:hypothetical protein
VNVEMYMLQSVPGIAWGKRTRVILDVGCGVASFGGYLFDRDVLAMSFAPKDEHEAQIQFALERGIPAISAVMGTKRLPYPGRVFDAVHCARCRVPWHIEGMHIICISSDRFKLIQTFDFCWLHSLICSICQSLADVQNIIASDCKSCLVAIW